MQVLTLNSCENPALWLSQIREADWSAAQLLYALYTEGKIEELLGNGARISHIKESEEL